MQMDIVCSNTDRKCCSLKIVAKHTSRSWMPSHDRSSRQCLNNPWTLRSSNELGLSPAQVTTLRRYTRSNISLRLTLLCTRRVSCSRFRNFRLRDRRSASKSRTLGFRDIRPCPSHLIIRAPATFHLPLYTMFFVSSCSQPRTMPRLLAWWSGTLGWRRHSTIPGSRVRFSDGRTYFNWSWEIIRKRGGCRFLSTWRGWFLLLRARSVCKCVSFLL